MAASTSIPTVREAAATDTDTPCSNDRNARTVEEFVQLISAAWNKQVASIQETGRLLIQAKATLKHGEFGAMIKDKLPFGTRTAQMLMRIANDPIIGNAKYISLLPPCWGTLYDLTELPQAEKKQMLADGRIHPELERKDLDETVKKFRDEGVFLAKLPSRLAGLIGFMQAWPDARVLADGVVDGIFQLEDTDEDFDLDALKKLARWISKLQAACAPKYERECRRLDRWRSDSEARDQRYRQQADQIRAKLAAEIQAEREARAETSISKLKIALTDVGGDLMGNIPVYLPGRDLRFSDWLRLAADDDPWVAAEGSGYSEVGERVGSVTVKRDRCRIEYTCRPVGSFSTIKEAVR